MSCSVALLVLVAAVAGVLAAESGDVLVLDTANFENEIDKDIILVEFYAPW